MKKLLYILLAIVLIVVVGIGALLALVDPNQFKPLLSEQVKKATGRDLVIAGDISWRFFPSIGFNLGETEFRNPDGFAEPNLVKLGSAELSVSVMPLFSQHLDIGNVSLYDARVFIQTRADGVSNLDGLGEQQAEVSEPATLSAPAEAEPEAAVPESKETSQPWSISLVGMELVNASAIIRDDKAGTITEVSRLNFSLAHFSPGEWTNANFDVIGNNGELSFTAKGETGLLIQPGFKDGELKALTLSATAKDSVNDIEVFELGVDKFKVGEWSTISYNTKGQVPDLVFDANGQTRLKLSKDFNVAELEQLTLAAKLKGNTLPRPEMTVKLDADANYDVAKGLATLSRFETAIDEIAMKGKGSFQSADIPAIRFAVNSDNIDLDAFLGLKQEPSSKPSAEDGKQASSSQSGSQSDEAAPVSDIEPDLSVLKTLDLAGTVNIGKLKAANARVSNVQLDVNVKKGVLKLNRFDANLYGGSVNAQATIDANGKLPKYQVTKQIKGVQIQPMLIDIAQNDTLAGTGNIDVTLSGAGLAEKRIRQNTSGTIDINFADGAIYGVNIPQMIREAKATLKGRKAEYVKEDKKTDFSALTATVKLGKGEASTNNLHLASPLLRIDGKGNTNLMSEAIDFTINTSVVATSKGQGGKEIDEVADLTVPIDVKGDWKQPTFSLNLKKLLKQNNELEEKAKKEVDRGLEKLLGDKAKDDKIKNAADKLLKGLFN
ncbi:AsmA family protein [Photobacterium lipolyticum]|uniref:AsmA family protein n=1 Tax=Photobacterium lipolyticum TaxID=266810 RepID=A0A2T3MT20_9GAMM|nr:AsmA family protein [Photobacterium lipolyticum]PSW01160.1 AsmA family protein [Photobacterium lipolyticum]